MLIKTPIGKNYGAISALQGIRSLGSDIYLICGTTNPNPNTGYGYFYIGEIDCISGTSYYLNVPESLGTSLYGPDYNKENGIYTFVGSFLNYKQNINGFIFQGTLNDLNNKLNFSFPSVNSIFDTTFLHSYSNGLFVGNSGNSNDVINLKSYIYDINNLNNIKTEILFPGSVTTTSYGIIYNDNNIYTIVGGYTNKKINIKDIYNKSGIINPFGTAFIVDYNSLTNIFSNWTSINKNENSVTHFQGISLNEDNTYSINADSVNLLESKLQKGYYLKISRNARGEFISNVDNWIELAYKNEGFTSSNSVANNKVVGLYILNNNIQISYQAEIINSSLISKKNLNQTKILKNALVKFDNAFINNNFINYKNGIFTFLEKGTYFINFNIYIENTNLSSVNFNIEYTVNSVYNTFLLAQKGIDDIGTGTAHSLVLPCSFIENFDINDEIKIRNTSDGEIILISNYVEDSVNALCSINKLH